MKRGIIKLIAITGALAMVIACSSTRTQQSAGEVIDDSVLTSKVKLALVEDPVTKAGQINVETFRGVVQLGGFVDNAQAKEQATKVARSVTGVKEVRNDLRVSTPRQRWPGHRRRHGDRLGQVEARRGPDHQGTPDQRRNAEGRRAADRVRGLDGVQGSRRRTRWLRRRGRDGSQRSRDQAE